MPSKRKPIADTPFLKKARERFKLANEADSPQAERERDDLAFYAGDQWPADIKLARLGQQPQSGMPAVPARPTLVINKVREPIRQIQNQIRGADIGVEVVPADDFGDLGVTPDETEVTLREGLVRRILRESDAQQAMNWGGDRANIAGRGYATVMTRFLPGKTWDQEIYVDRIFNQAGVKGDPSRTQPDGSDAEYWFIGSWMLWEKFIGEYPEIDGDDNPFTNFSEEDFIAQSEAYPGWYRQSFEVTDNDGKKSTIKQQAIRITDYWYTERTSRTLAILNDHTAVWVEDLQSEKPAKGKKTGKPIAPEGRSIVDTRTVVDVQIKWAKLAGGCLLLEETDWAAPCMPIVEFLGEELQPYDEQRRVEGMVRNARDSNMGFNYMVSKQVEQVGLTPIPALQVDPEAIDRYEAWYQVLNTRSLPYAPYRTYNDDGKQLAPPQRLNVEPNVLAISQSIGLFDQLIKSTTAVPDPTLGNVDPSLKSGRAIRETVMNAQQSTSNFLENRVVAWRRLGTIINELLYPIYGARPGRLVRVMTGEGDGQMMQIGQGPQDPQQQAQQQKAAKVAKLTKDAKFNVIIKVTKNFESRRNQEFTELGAQIEKNPALMGWFGDLYFKNSDMPGRQSLSDRAKVMLAPPIQQMLAAQEEGTIFDPVAQAKIAQLTQQLQELEQIAQQLHQQAEGKQLDAKVKLDLEDKKQQAEAQRAQVEAERDIKLQEMKDATTIRVAEINAAVKGYQTEAQHAAQHEQQATNIAAQAVQSDLERENQSHEAQQARDHEAAMASAQAETAKDAQMADHEHQTELVKTKPKPNGSGA